MQLIDLVKRIRRENPGLEVPDFDPENGNEAANILFLLEAPGAKAIQTGYVSINNPDPTARNFRVQLEEAGIASREYVIWNAVPWYLGNSSKKNIRAAQISDVNLGKNYLSLLLDCLPKLKFIVLVGSKARQLHIFLSYETNAKILSCHHTSAKVMNTNQSAKQENIKVFKAIKRNLG